MLSIPVDENGTSLTYIDSGPVDSDTYTTLVCLHGHTYHSENFRRVVADAAAHDMRIVAVDRRDYCRSTLYSADELDDLNSDDPEARQAFLRERGLEIARFLARFVETEHIPRSNKDGTAGGLALLGWSAGNMTTLAFLGHVDLFPRELIQTLGPYLRAFIIYDTPHVSIGVAPPANMYSPLEDMNIPEHERAKAFGTWVSSYYTHPDPSSRSPSGLQCRLPTSPHRLATSEAMPPNELMSVIDLAPGPRSEQGFIADKMRESLLKQTRWALFDERRARDFPRLKVLQISCAESAWPSYWASWWFEKEIERCESAGVHGRQVKMIKLDGANHFLHWDDPERWLDIFAASIGSGGS